MLYSYFKINLKGRSLFALSWIFWYVWKLQNEHCIVEWFVSLTLKIYNYLCNPYHLWCCELESRSGRGVQHYVIIKKSLSVVSSGSFCFIQHNWPSWYNWNIVESGVKHHHTSKHDWIYILETCVIVRRSCICLFIHEYLLTTGIFKLDITDMGSLPDIHMYY
jgi:hypothetical protein